MNIIHMNEFERARKGFNSQEAVSLLRECRELAIRRLSAALISMMGKVDDALFELAEKAENNAVQTLYFDAMREVRLKRASMEIGFKAKLLEGFNREIRKENETAESGSPAPELRMNDMDLMQHDELEESLAVSNMVSKIEIGCKEALGMLNRRIGYLLNDPELVRAKNPIGPEVVCNAFREACEVESGIKVKLIIMKLFDRYVVSEEMLSLYQDVNKLLIERGVLPELRHEVKRNPNARATPAAAGATGEAAQAGANAAATASEEDVFATLQQLMLRGLPGAGQGGMAGLFGGRGFSGTAEQVSSADVVNNLTLLQQGNGELVAGGVGQLSNADLVSGSVNVIREIRTAGAFGNVGAVDGMIIDVVAMLFDYILDDNDVPAVMKVLIGRLQIPMLKVGMLDKSFFSRKTHPARRLLNRLAEAAVGWNGEEDKGLYKKVESIVQQVLVEFESDVTLFATLLEDFEAFLAKEDQKAEHHEAQSTRLVQGKEKLKLAKQQVRIEIERRGRNNAIPKFVRQFLVSYWQNLLLITLIKEGEGSVAWKRGLTTMDNLIWSLQRKTSVTERDRLVKMLPSLLRTLREGMELISMREDEFQGFLEQLATHHAMIVNAVPRDSDAANDADILAGYADDPLAELSPEDNEPVVEDKQVTTATIHRLVTAGDIEVEEITLGEEDDEPQEQIEDEFVEQARSLHQGAWVEFMQEDGETLRAKLTWVSPVTGIYLFTNRQGLKACDKTLQGLATELRRGGARILDGAPLFERAVNCVIDGLRKQAVG